MSGALTNAIVYFHFPFDTGIFVGQSMTRLQSIATELERNYEEFDVKCAPLEIGRLELPEEYAFHSELYLLRRVLFVSFPRTRQIMFEAKDMNSTLSEFQLCLFSSGVAIVRFKSELVSMREISPKRLLDYQGSIFKLSSDKSSELGSIIWRLIHAITESVRKLEEGNNLASYPRRTTSAGIDYLYPVYYFPTDIDGNLMRKYLNLLYFRDTDDISSADAESKLSSNSSILKNCWLIIDWNASVVAGIRYTSIIGGYARVFEIMSFVWYSMYRLDNMLAEELRDLLDRPPTLSIREAEARLSKIRLLRQVVNDVLEEYRNIRISLWRSVIDLFDKIARSWAIGRLERSLASKTKLLDYVLRDITQLLDRRHNEELERILLRFQHMALSLAIIIGLLPFFTDAMRIGLPVDQYMRLWLYPSLAITILLVAVLVGDSVAILIWKRRFSRIRTS